MLSNEWCMNLVFGLGTEVVIIQTTNFSWVVVCPLMVYWNCARHRTYVTTEASYESKSSNPIPKQCPGILGESIHTTFIWNGSNNILFDVDAMTPTSCATTRVGVIVPSPNQHDYVGLELLSSILIRLHAVRIFGALGEWWIWLWKHVYKYWTT